MPNGDTFFFFFSRCFSLACCLLLSWLFFGVFVPEWRLGTWRGGMHLALCRVHLLELQLLPPARQTLRRITQLLCVRAEGKAAILVREDDTSGQQFWRRKLSVSKGFLCG